eukprot:g43302.t1
MAVMTGLSLQLMGEGESTHLEVAKFIVESVRKGNVLTFCEGVANADSVHRGDLGCEQQLDLRRVGQVTQKWELEGQSKTNCGA